jgi:hypothetical protein
MKFSHSGEWFEELGILFLFTKSYVLSRKEGAIYPFLCDQYEKFTSIT